MSDSKEFAQLSDLNLTDLFIGDRLQVILKEIETEVLATVPDVSTLGSRKKIASMARKVASSKVAIDNAGKELVKEWKEKLSNDIQIIEYQNELRKLYEIPEFYLLQTIKPKGRLQLHNFS